MGKRVRRDVSAAEKSEMPGFITQLATLKSKAQAEISSPQCLQPSLSTSVLKPSGIRGAAPSSGTLQDGQGIPAPPQSQA